MSCVIRFRNRGFFIFFDEAHTVLDDPLRVACLNLLGVAAEDLVGRAWIPGEEAVSTVRTDEETEEKEKRQWIG
jgi:hypothetical protein